MVGLFVVVDWGPFVADTEIVWETVMVGEAVVCRWLADRASRDCVKYRALTVFYAVFEHQFRTFSARFPPLYDLQVSITRLWCESQTVRHVYDPALVSYDQESVASEG